MNIVTPIPTTLVTPTANVNTEAARRDNVLRETIPQTSDPEQSASQQGLGSESDRARSPGQQAPPLTYERPQVQTGNGEQGQISAESGKDNARDESAGRETAEQKQEEASRQEIEELKARDREVRTHEQAHAAMGGQYAGAPRYEYTQGPDGRRYVTDGEVSIDISEAKSPEQTLRKMEQVRAAALAPAQPSAQDLKVAAEASQKAVEARADIAREQVDAVSVSSASDGANTGSVSAPSLDEIVENGDIRPPKRALSDAVLSTSEAIREGREPVQQSESRRSLESGELSRTRNTVIQQFYADSVTPSGTGFNTSA